MKIWSLREQLNGKLKPRSAVLPLECHTDQWLAHDSKLTFSFPSQHVDIKSGKALEQPEEVLVVLVNDNWFIQIKMFTVRAFL